MYTFDLRFSEIWSRMFYLYLVGGVGEDEFFAWIDKNVDTATETVVRRKNLDLGPLEASWARLAPLRRSMKELPVATR